MPELERQAFYREQNTKRENQEKGTKRTFTDAQGVIEDMPTSYDVTCIAPKPPTSSLGRTDGGSDGRSDGRSGGWGAQTDGETNEWMVGWKAGRTVGSHGRAIGLYLQI